MLCDLLCTVFSVVTFSYIIIKHKGLHNLVNKQCDLKYLVCVYRYIIVAVTLFKLIK